MSVLVFPPAPLGDVGWLTALGAVAAAEVVEAATRLPARIKWPNDVLLGGRKVAGILVERHRGAVIGIGLNVNAGVDDLPEELRATATSLRIAAGERLDRSELARELIRRLDRHYAGALALGASALNAAWRSRLEPIGRPVRLATHSGTVAGLLMEADLDSGLTLTAADGRSIRVANAEVLAFDAEAVDTGPA
jgi:BirA family biotin operon repressor/biotin-[acetyl-CoA-carboxylase] ligase